MALEFFLKLDNSPEPFLIGEESFGNFWSDTGYQMIVKAINDFPQYLDQMQIFDSKNKKYSIEQFIDTIKKFKIKKH